MSSVQQLGERDEAHQIATRHRLARRVVDKAIGLHTRREHARALAGKQLDTAGIPDKVRDLTGAPKPGPSVDQRTGRSQTTTATPLPAAGREES